MYCKRQEVDEHSPSYLGEDLFVTELEKYKSDDEPSCDAVPLGWQTLGLRHIDPVWFDKMLSELKPELKGRLEEAYEAELESILEEAYPKDSEL